MSQTVEKSPSLLEGVKITATPSVFDMPTDFAADTDMVMMGFTGLLQTMKAQNAPMLTLQFAVPGYAFIVQVLKAGDGAGSMSVQYARSEGALQ